MRCRTVFAALVAACWMGLPSSAADYTDTKDYVAKCDMAVPSQDCILDYQIAQAAGNWGATTDTGMCPPTPSMSDENRMFAELRAQVHAVVSWLKKHPEVNPSFFGEGITTAGHALYPCTAAARQPKKTVRHFLAECAKDATSCNDMIAAVETIDTVDGAGHAPYCVAQAAQVRTGVTGWLKAHPEMKSQDYDTAVSAALKALYPCKS